MGAIFHPATAVASTGRFTALQLQSRQHNSANVTSPARAESRLVAFSSVSGSMGGELTRRQTLRRPATSTTGSLAGTSVEHVDNSGGEAAMATVPKRRRKRAAAQPEPQAVGTTKQSASSEQPPAAAHTMAAGTTDAEAKDGSEAATAHGVLLHDFGDMEEGLVRVMSWQMPSLADL